MHPLLRPLSVATKLRLMGLPLLLVAITLLAGLVREQQLARQLVADEREGVAFLSPLIPAFVDAALLGASAPSGPRGEVAQRLPEHLKRLQSLALPPDLLRDTQEPRQAFMAGLQTLLDSAQTDPLAALSAGQRLILRIGNSSRLVLDPELDSYYAMSMVVFRHAEVVRAVGDISSVLRSPEALARADWREELRVLQAQLDATVARLLQESGELQSTLATGKASGQLRTRAPGLEGALATTLSSDSAVAWGDALARHRRAVLALVDLGTGAPTPPGAPAVASLLGAQRELLQALGSHWMDGLSRLDDLLEAREAHLQQRQALHLGVAALMLGAAIWASLMIAQHIRLPLEALDRTVARVNREQDLQARVNWHSTDEIGRGIAGYHSLLEALAASRQRLADDAARSHEAQGLASVLESLPWAVCILHRDTQMLLYANPACRAWLGGVGTAGHWHAFAQPAAREAFLEQLDRTGQVEACTTTWLKAGAAVPVLLSARSLRHQQREAFAVVIAPLSPQTEP